MSKYPSVWPTALAHLKAVKPEYPVLYFSPGVLQDSARAFRAGFAGLVTYAVKANDARVVLENLITAGITTFDVASPAEIRKLRAINPHVTLHYNNPVRSPDEIAEAHAAGVVSYAVDALSELAKLRLQVPPEGVEVAVRLRLPVTGAVYDFGSKFGEDPAAAVLLLKAVAAAGYAPAMTFHTGTQCTDPAAWATYIGVCADVARRAGVRLERLNVGGGFPANRGTAPDLLAIFAAIEAALAANFGGAVQNAPALVCEPGRALVHETYVLATQVKALRECGAVFLNDGIYGTFGEALTSLGVVARVSTLTRAGLKHRGAMSQRVIYGPTCDSLDRLPGKIALPDDLAEGDYVLFGGMGAYSTATVTRFNGYGAVQMVTVQSGEI